MESKFFDDRKIDIIVHITCNYFNIKPKETFALTREHPYKQARQIIHYLSWKHTKKSLADIGKASLKYGRPMKHDHATVLYSRNTVQNDMETDINFMLDVQNIEYAFKLRINEASEQEKAELTTLELNHRLEQELFEARQQNQELRNHIKHIKDNVKTSSENPYIKRLLSCDEQTINEVCETKLKPFFLMYDSRVTNKDLIDFQYKSRNNKKAIVNI